MPGATTRKRRRTQHQPTGTWIRPVKRLAIYLRDGFVCLQCGDDLHGAARSAVTLDHRIPLSRGGSNEATNLYTCCRRCNSARGARTAGSARIRKHARRSLRRYLALASALLSGRVDKAVITLTDIRTTARGWSYRYPGTTPIVPQR